MQGLRSSDRSSGVILHPTSLPGPFGVGDLGAGAYQWVELLAATGTGLWQTLPVGPTGYGDSPYQCFSAFAGNINLIAPDLLVDDGLIEPPEMPDFTDEYVDFGAVIPWKRSVLASAYSRFRRRGGDPAIAEDFERFRSEQFWLDDHAQFMAIKAAHGGGSWQDWPDELRLREPRALASARQRLSYAIDRTRFSQFLFFRQWDKLHRHATSREVQIIGDVPIFVAGDSADVWSNPDLFLLDEMRRPTVVAGVPPDYFSETGQLWGNPLYNWSRHEETGFAWWIDRLHSTFSIADVGQRRRRQAIIGSEHVDKNLVTLTRRFVRVLWAMEPDQHTRVRKVAGPGTYVLGSHRRQVALQSISHNGFGLLIVASLRQKNTECVQRVGAHRTLDFELVEYTQALSYHA
jgi:4-alpha-glucanotransferase